MVSCGKGSFFATTKNWLNISFYLFIQTEVMDYIYCFYKSEMVLFEVLQRSSEREKVSQFAYITCAGSTWFLPYLCLSPSVYNIASDVMIKVRNITESQVLRVLINATTTASTLPSVNRKNYCEAVWCSRG